MFNAFSRVLFGPTPTTKSMDNHRNRSIQMDQLERMFDEAKADLVKDFEKAADDRFKPFMDQMRDFIRQDHPLRETNDDSTAGVNGIMKDNKYGASTSASSKVNKHATKGTKRRASASVNESNEEIKIDYSTDEAIEYISKTSTKSTSKKNKKQQTQELSMEEVPETPPKKTAGGKKKKSKPASKPILVADSDEETELADNDDDSDGDDFVEVKQKEKKKPKSSEDNKKKMKRRRRSRIVLK